MNVNMVILAGNLTRDIELSYTPSQVAVASFGIAVNKKYKDKETTLFVDVVAFSKTAEAMSKYLKKGDPIFIQGELQFDSWTTNEGQKRSKHKVLVNSFQFIGGRKAAAQEPDEPQRHQDDQPDYDPNSPDDIPF